MNSESHSVKVTFLFTDIEGSTRLWEREPKNMPGALARHDALTRHVIEANRGRVVKMIGDGVHAAFEDAADAVVATVQLQQALADPSATNDIPLLVRCGLHCGTVEQRNNDYFGTAVNRAARIMRAANGGQIVLSSAVVDSIRDRTPAELTLRDLGSIRLRDLSTAEHVYQVVHPGLRQDFPALRSLEATPNNLPQQVTSFVGREHDRAQVKELLANTRLLTLFGTGGLGKTRLSIEVAADVMSDFPDGVWLVELASTPDARLVPQSVASVLGVKEEAGRPVQEALLKFVKDRELLLVLDNCEHLLGACAETAEQLLRAGARVKVLATSREPLHIAGETTLHVPPLALPAPDQAGTIDGLMQYEAVRLFVDRARAVQPAFAATSDNASALAEICQRLDGIPLAIELAAARLRALSVDKIAERLTDVFGLLTRGNRTDLPRQQTLRALIDWSYDLLDEAEKSLFMRLSVFAGGFTLEAAEAVASGEGIDSTDVLDRLSALVDKSLVEIDADGERYRMLETVRQYASDKLEQSGDERERRTRHLAYYVRFVQQADRKLQGPAQAEWLARFALERENFLSAHAWCDFADNGAEQGLTLAHATELYWSYRGLLELGHRITTEALDRSGAHARTVARYGALASAGNLSYWMGRYVEARRHLDEALSIAREIGEGVRIANALMLLGRVAHGQGDMAAAREHFEESLALARSLGDKHRLASTLNALGELHRAQGDLDLAEPIYEEALALRREQGDASNIAVNLLNLVMVSIGRGSADRAHAMLLEALTIAQATASKRMGQGVLEVSAALAAFQGDSQRAATMYGAAEAQREQMGLAREPVDQASLAPLIRNTRRALGDAAFAAAERAGGALSYEDALGQARAWLQVACSRSADTMASIGDSSRPV